MVVMAGPRRALEVLPAIIACGVSFAGVQFYVSNFWGPELTDIASSLTCIGVMVLVLKIWKPRTILRLEGDTRCNRPASPSIRPAQVCGRVAALHVAGRMRRALGRAIDQTGAQSIQRQLLPGFVAKSSTGPERSPGALDCTMRSHGFRR